MCGWRADASHFRTSASNSSVVRGRDDLNQRALVAGQYALDVARQHRFEGLFVLPFRVSWCPCLDLVDSEGELDIVRLLRPQRAVVVECGNAFFRPNVV